MPVANGVGSCRVPLALLAFLLALLTGLPAEAGPNPEEFRLLELVNEARRDADLSPVALDKLLSEVARAHAWEMINLGYFGHISPQTGTPARRVRRAGVTFSFVGENLAGHPSPEAAHQALLESGLHRRNILHADVTLVGLAYVRGGPYGAMVVQVFVAPPTQADNE